MIQTIGRAARNVNGHVIMYADRVTGSMQRAIDETDRRRAVQEAIILNIILRLSLSLKTSKSLLS